MRKRNGKIKIRKFDQLIDTPRRSVIVIEHFPNQFAEYKARILFRKIVKEIYNLFYNIAEVNILIAWQHIYLLRHFLPYVDDAILRSLNQR